MHLDDLEGLTLRVEQDDCDFWSIWATNASGSGVELARGIGEKPVADLIAASPALLHAAEEAMREATNDIAGIDRDEALAILSSIAGILGPAIKQARGA